MCIRDSSNHAHRVVTNTTGSQVIFVVFITSVDRLNVASLIGKITDNLKKIIDGCGKRYPTCRNSKRVYRNFWPHMNVVVASHRIKLNALADQRLLLK